MHARLQVVVALLARRYKLTGLKPIPRSSNGIVFNRDPERILLSSGRMDLNRFPTKFAATSGEAQTVTTRFIALDIVAISIRLFPENRL
jgi:hypothetical protein